METGKQNKDSSVITLSGLPGPSWKCSEAYTFEVRQERETEKAIMYRDVHSRRTTWIPKSAFDKYGLLKPWAVCKILDEHITMVEAVYAGR